MKEVIISLSTLGKNDQVSKYKIDKRIYKEILRWVFHSHGLNSNNKSHKNSSQIPTFLITPLLLDVIIPKKPVI